MDTADGLVRRPKLSTGYAASPVPVSSMSSDSAAAVSSRASGAEPDLQIAAANRSTQQQVGLNKGA
ncbi:hypothetical protein HQO83_06830 [Rhodococcus fascians]|nr:hypothetical protein [Rhodococcus fascians]